MSDLITKSSLFSCWHCKTRFSFVNLKLHNCTVPSEHISIGRNINNFSGVFFPVKILTNEKQLIGLVRPWLYYEYCTDLVFAVQSTQQLNLPDSIQHRVITKFQTENYTKLEIKPCWLGSRIGDMEAEWRLRVITGLISWWSFGKQNWHCEMNR